MQVILFKLEDKVYGLELQYCKEIDELKHLTQIQYSSENYKNYIEGITNLRGDIITVINLKKLFDLKNKSYEQNIFILLKVKKGKIGILIDQIMDIVNLENYHIDYSKGHIESKLIPYIKFTVILNHKPILILNPESF